MVYQVGKAQGRKTGLGDRQHQGQKLELQTGSPKASEVTFACTPKGGKVEPCDALGRLQAE